MPQVIPSEGTLFEIGETTPDTQFCPTSYNRQAGSKNERDRTTLCDLETITGYGLVNNGTATFNYFLDPADDAQILMEAANKTNATLKFKHTLPNGYFRTADIIVTEISDEAAQDADYTASVTFRLNNLSTWTAPPP
jgi:hypothetical protein